MGRSYTVLIPQRMWLLIGTFLSAAGHFAAIGAYLSVGERVREVVHRITFEPPSPPNVFHKPARTATRVLEFRKRPIPRRQARHRALSVERQVQQVHGMLATRTERLLDQLVAADIAPASLRQSARLRIDRPGVGNLSGSVSAPALTPLSEVAVRATSEAIPHVDLELDLLAVEDMDTGQYHAMVVQEPGDRLRVGS